MRKSAAIDIGTNSVLYSLFEIKSGTAINEIHFERHSPRIGGNLKGRSAPRISEESYRRLLAILSRHVRHARRSSAEKILIAATNPLRLAQNGRDIRRRLEENLAVPVTILSPQREAHLSFLGAVGTLRSRQKAMIIDLGGGSTELVAYGGEKRLDFVSLPEGAVSLTEKLGIGGQVNKDKFIGFEKELNCYRSRIAGMRPFARSGVILVGGTSSALANLKNPDFLTTKEDTVLSIDELNLIIQILARLNLSGRRKLLAFDKKRAEIIFAGAFWLSYLFKILGLRQALATPRGLRHGMVLYHLAGEPITA